MISLKSILLEQKKVTNHPTYKNAIKSAIEWADSLGYEIDDSKSASEIKKTSPEEGKSVKFSVTLTKNTVPTRKKLYISILNAGTFKRGKGGEKVRSVAGGQSEFEMKCEIK